MAVDAELTDEQYQQFDSSDHVPPEYVEAGWHFCAELDDALVNRKDVSSFCKCYDEPTSQEPKGS